MGSMLDEMEKAGEEAAAQGNQTTETSASDDGAMEINEIEATGIIQDRYGHTWQVPADNVEDLDDLYAGEVYKIPDELSKDFFVQLIPLKKLRDYQARGFVPVTLEEMEIPSQLMRDGSPLDNYHVTGDSLLVKIPWVIRERLEARKIKEVKDRLKEIEPTKEMAEKARQNGFAVRFERTTRADIVDPTKRPPLITGSDQG